MGLRYRLSDGLMQFDYANDERLAINWENQLEKNNNNKN